MAILTAGELEVMKVLWEHGELTPAQIEEHFPRPIKNAALRFQLRVLMEKKHVARRKAGRAFLYWALTPREGSFKKMVRRLAEAFFNGSTSGLIAELMKSEKFTEAEIEELQRIAASRTAKKSSGKKGGRQS